MNTNEQVITHEIEKVISVNNGKIDVKETIDKVISFDNWRIKANQIDTGVYGQDERIEAIKFGTDEISPNHFNRLL